MGGEIRRLGRKEEKEKADQSFGRHISLRVGKTIRARMIKYGALQGPVENEKIIIFCYCFKVVLLCDRG